VPAAGADAEAPAGTPVGPSCRALLAARKAAISAFTAGTGGCRPTLGLLPDSAARRAATCTDRQHIQTATAATLSMHLRPHQHADRCNMLTVACCRQPRVMLVPTLLAKQCNAAGLTCLTLVELRSAVRSAASSLSCSCPPGPSHLAAPHSAQRCCTAAFSVPHRTGLAMQAKAQPAAAAAAGFMVVNGVHCGIGCAGTQNSAW
jgi:hypothetical protein